MLHNLPWLAPAGDVQRSAFAAVAAAPVCDFAAWRRLLAYGWTESELRRAGKRVRVGLTDASAPALAAASIVTFKLLVIAAQTFSHMSEVVIASALRHGVALELDVVEYLDPQGWLDNPNNRADGYDGVLIAADARAWRLDVALGSDSAGETAMLSRMADRASEVLRQFTDRGARAIILQTVADDLSEIGLHIDASIFGSRARMQRGFNERLGALAAEAGHLVLDIARLSHLVGIDAWWPGRYWFSAKLPFAPQCVPLYGDNLARLLAARVGKSRRVLVLDLDNTLWGGVIGDDGLEGISIGQGSALGEAHLAVQWMAKAYAARGIVLCVSSKNTHDIAIDVFQRHPDMLLKEDDIALFSINWNDKASNLRLIAEQLGLGLEALVFLDDNPVERKQVRDMLPEVAVPELPLDPAQWPLVMAGAGYFEQLSFTPEDQLRGRFYKSLAARSLPAAAGDTSQHLESLDTTVEIAPFDAVGRKRIAQLISKSNQFNLTTRRYSEQEIHALETDPSAITMQIRLKDMFGDAGMISVVVAHKIEDRIDIDLWLMSCRVLSRRVQEAALIALARRARDMGATTLRGCYAPTPRNGIVADHYGGLGFEHVGDGADGMTIWELDLARYSAPELPMKIVETRETREII